MKPSSESMGKTIRKFERIFRGLAPLGFVLLLLVSINPACGSSTSAPSAPVPLLSAGHPVGATFDAVYNGAFNYVVWNDQFYNDPQIVRNGGPADIRQLVGALGTDFNHAKIGVSTSGSDPDAIFGDMNQQGTLSGPNCGSSQNGRGGLFYVLKNRKLHDNIAQLISGASAPAQALGWAN